MLVLPLVTAALLTLPQAPQSSVPTREVEALAAQVDRDWPSKAREQSITHEALHLLADAIQAVSAKQQLHNPAIPKGLQELRDRIERYAGGIPGSPGQSRYLRTTLLTASIVIRTVADAADMDESMRPRLNALRRAARSVDTDDPIGEQPNVLERFFHLAAAALRQLDVRPA